MDATTGVVASVCFVASITHPSQSPLAKILGQWHTVAALPEMTAMSKLIVFELDGGTWDIINPLVEQGRLPNLARLKQQGAWGILHSIKPMISPALWATIFTGKTRERHGVQTFADGSHQIRCKRLWDIAYERGLTCGVCGSLSTWPPYDVGGFMIPDVMARGPETIPANLSFLQELVIRQLRGTGGSKVDRFAYVQYPLKMHRAGVTLQTLFNVVREVASDWLMRRQKHESYWRRALLLQQIYADVFVRLCNTHQPDFATYHYHAIDTLSHRYWHYLFPDTLDVSPEEVARYRDVIPSAYEAADSILGQFLSLAGHDTTVVVLSDHGFHASPEIRSRHIARLPRWIEVLNLEQTVFPTRLGLQHFLYFADKTKIEPIAQTLALAYVKETGARVLRKVEVGQESLLFEPELVYASGATVVFPDYGEWPFEELFQNTGHVTSGGHHTEGIVLVMGPHVSQGLQLSNASVLDVAPNILALLELPVARDMDGKVWKSIFTENACASISSIETYETENRAQSSADYSDDEREELYQRLQDLGYL
jgi:predicted AlkP superfamily phosphohydrolase/phosphomutase